MASFFAILLNPFDTLLALAATVRVAVRRKIDRASEEPATHRPTIPLPVPSRTPSSFGGRQPVGAKLRDVDIGVVYTDEDDWMRRLLSTVSQSADGLKAGLILVDNRSRNGIEPWLQYFPHTQVLHNSKRLSYAANLNQILRASRARYVLLLNTDMFFDPQQQCIAEMVRFMDSRPDCGVAGCRLHHADGAHAPSARRFQTLATVLARRCGLKRWLGRALDRYFYREHAIDETWDCQWLSGCFLMVRREAFAEVGPFDEGYGKYFEDVDMCLRMARAGWRVMYHGATYCYHLEQRSSRNLLSADARKHARSYFRWLGKWGWSPERALPQPQQRRKAA